MAAEGDIEDLRAVFRSFDENNDGVIDGSELGQVLKRLDEATWTDDAVDNLMKIMDENGDGTVQYEELVNWLSGGLDCTLKRNFYGAVRRLSLEDSDDASAQESGDDADADAADAEASKPAAKAKTKPRAKKKAKVDSVVGVKCQKTLEFGKPIRSAVCIGKEVWTVDWQGLVTVRDRDNASKTVGEISTSRFVWSMLHMKPGLMWMGQEANGISLFNSKKKEAKGSLTGGHTGGILCLACDDSLGDDDAESFPVRKAWSGSNDFTIREWWIHTWRGKKATPAEVKDDRDVVVVELGKWKVGISKGRQMYGHKNGVKSLLKLGPMLWSGSDDGSIRLWRCVDGDCVEIVEDAHAGSVSQLKVVKSFVWSAGSDGVIKEWTMGGEKRQCVRQVSPPGCEKGIYALLPLGNDVWVCGHHPAIQVFSQRDMFQISEEDGHSPYVSNLIGVDRIETKMVWSTSFGDRKLKVWHNTIRGEEASVDELKAANILYQQEEETQAQRLHSYMKRLATFEETAAQHQAEVDKLSQELADKSERCAALEKELADLRQIFEEANATHLLDDADALKALLQRGMKLEEALKALGLEHLLDDPEELARRAKMSQQLQEDLEKSARDLEEALANADALRKQLDEQLKTNGSLGDKMQQLQEILARCGFEGVLDDPSSLEDVLKRYNGLKSAFVENGMEHMFEDVQKFETFLKTHVAVRKEFRDAGLEQLLDDPAVASEFLSRYEESRYDRNMLQKLRQVFEEAGQEHLLVEYEAVSTTDGGEDPPEADFSDEGEDEDNEDEEDGDEEDDDEDEDEGEEDDEDEDDDEDAERRRSEEKARRKAEKEAAKAEREAEKQAAKAEREAEKQAAKASAVKLKREQSNQGPCFPALRRYLKRTTAFENVLRDVGMEYLLDDPSELGRLLRQLKDWQSVLATHGLEDLSSLSEMLSAYKAIRAAFEEHGMEDIVDDPDYSLKAFLKTYHRLRAEFDKHGLGYFFDSVPSLRDFLAKHFDMEQELKAMKAARTGEKLAERDAEMARLDARLAKKEAEIEELKARLKEFEQLGNIDVLRKWKADSDELRRLQKLHSSLQARLAEAERYLKDKEREREEALARERMMAVKYKELDIFKLDVIARELKALDNELGSVGSQMKSLMSDASKLKNYDEQQRIGQSADSVLDDCKMLRAHIRDVIKKCLTETQKMHIGVAIDDHTAAGQLQDGGVMIGAVYEDIERPDHGHSVAAKLRQRDEVHGKRK